MSILHSRAFAAWAQRNFLCRAESSDGRFALTFDDGPSPTNTPRLLDVLARRGARATFFVLAGHVRRYPELLQRAAADGHEIGVHGVHHLPPALMPTGWLRRQIEACAATIAGVIGSRPRLYRAPFGWLLPAQARAVRTWGFEPVLGDIYPGDTPGVGPAHIARVVGERMLAGSIVMLHDSSVIGDASRSNTIAAVDEILAAAAARGLRSVSVAELAAGAAGAPRNVRPNA